MTTTWTIDRVLEALTAGKISARELKTDFYKRIEAPKPELHAFLSLTPERARRQADKSTPRWLQARLCPRSLACPSPSRT